MNAISTLEEASAIMTLIAMTDELPHDVKDETAHAAAVARRLVDQAIESLSEGGAA